MNTTPDKTPMELIADGMSYHDVSKSTGISSSVLHRQFQETGLSRAKRRPKNLSQKTVDAAKMVVAGSTYRAACEATGATMGRVHKAVKNGWGNAK